MMEAHPATGKIAGKIGTVLFSLLLASNGL